jgi:hypothetical protein
MTDMFADVAIDSFVTPSEPSGATDWFVEMPAFGVMGGVGLEWSWFWMGSWFDGSDNHDPGDEDPASVAFRRGHAWKGTQSK